MKTNISYPFRMIMGDLNKDRRQDMIILYDSNDYLSVWVGNGNGIFTDKKQYFTDFKSNPIHISSLLEILITIID